MVLCVLGGGQPKNDGLTMLELFVLRGTSAQQVPDTCPPLPCLQAISYTPTSSALTLGGVETVQ